MYDVMLRTCSIVYLLGSFVYKHPPLEWVFVCLQLAIVECILGIYTIAKEGLIDIT